MPPAPAFASRRCGPGLRWLGPAAAAALCTSPLGARAESLVEIADPGYGLAAPPTQKLPIQERIHQLRYPTLGLPALVQPGERFSALVHAGCSPDLGSLEARLSLVGTPQRLAVDLEVLAQVFDDPVSGLLRLHLRAPHDLLADHYDLELADEGCLRDTQPSAVRVYRQEGSQRMAVLADEQRGDPTGHLDGGPQNGALYPGRGLLDLAARRRAQVLAELEFLDPLLVLYPGDLCFGMDYPAEYSASWQRFGQARLAVFTVPGNHDAYADHSVQALPGWHRQLHKAAWCGGRMSPTAPLDGLRAVGGCVLGRLGSVLDYQLDYDGLEGFRRTLGPESYAFRVGSLRFVGLNSYAGSPARRMAVPFSLGRLRDWVELDLLQSSGMDPLLGAPLVDNYGGFLDPDTERWLGVQASNASAAGESLVVFFHHDPGAVYLGEPGVLPNEPFGTDPVGLGDFEVWNYDAGWDSDPHDQVAQESVATHGGARLLDQLAEQGATVVCGHAHYDDSRRLRGAGGDAGVRVVQVTTAGASLASDEAYRGYRLLELQDAGLRLGPYDPERGWASVPLGNFWVEPLPRADGPPDQRVHNGLPQELRGRLRFVLPAAEQGYRFRLASGERVQPADLLHTRDGLVALVALEVAGAAAAGPVAKEPAELSRAELRWELAEGNQPPLLRVGWVGRKLARQDRPLRTRAGRELRLSALSSEDPEGLFRVTWRLAGLEREGLSVVFPALAPGHYQLRLQGYDGLGAVSTASRELRVRRGLWTARAAGGQP